LSAKTREKNRIFAEFSFANKTILTHTRHLENYILEVH